MRLKENENSEKNQVVKKALSMALGTFSSRLLGVLRESLLTAYFSRAVTDAWTVAFRLPNIFRRLFGEGSLSVSFIPVFVECIHGKNDEASARNLVNSLYTFLLLILSVLMFLGIYYAEEVLRVTLDSKYLLNADKWLITVKMTQIMFGFIFLMSTYAYFMGILNALGDFALAAMAPTLFNLAMIVSTLIPQNIFSFSGEGLAWGVIVGGVLQTVVLIPALIKKGFFPKISFQLNNPEMKKVLKNMLPGLFGMGLFQFSLIVNQRFASSLKEGAITYIYLADRLLELPLSLVSVSLGSALLPTLSKFWALKDKEMMVSTSEYYLRLNLFIVLPAATGLYFLSYPIIELIYQHGKFGPEDVYVTSEVLKIWALIAIPTSCVRILVSSYYAIKNTWFPSVVSLMALVGHIILAPILMKYWGLRGLNISSLISNSLNFILLIAFHNYFIAAIPWKKLFHSLGKTLVICAFMAMGLQLYSPIRGWLGSGDGFFNRLIALAIVIFTAVVFFMFLSHHLRLQEYELTFLKVFKKIKLKGK